MFSEFEKLSKTVDTVIKDDARRIIRIVLERIAEEVPVHIIDVLWRRDAKDGAFLDPFTSIDRTNRGGPKGVFVDDTAKGVWPWVFRHNAHVWLEGLKTRSTGSPLHNLASGEMIEEDVIASFFEATDSIIAVPLEFRDKKRGLICLEAPRSSVFQHEDLDRLRSVGYWISNLIWKAEAYQFNRDQTIEMINQFDAAVRLQKFRQSRVRTGFVARPFDPSFNAIENVISDLFGKHQVRVSRYQPRGSSIFIFEDISSQIFECHFAIVDITGINPNVVAELGMLFALKKRLLLMRRADDNLDLPFDLRNHFCHEYEIAQGNLVRVRDSAGGQARDLREIIETFLEELRSTPEFADARPWEAA